MFPAFIRSRSMNPLEFAWTRSCPRSTARWIVSTCVSIRMAARCSASVDGVGCLRSAGTIGLSLFQTDAGLGGDRREFLDFARDELLETVDRGRAAHDVVLSHPGLQFRFVENRVRLGVQPGDDGRRRPGGGHDAEPLADIEVRTRSEENT